MKCLYLAFVLLCAFYVMAMPSKASFSPEDDYGVTRQIPDHYQLLFLAPLPSDDRQRLNLEALQAYANGLNMDSQMFRKLLLAKLSMSGASKIKKNFDEIDKVSGSYSTLNQLT